jgi:hypothetical protein
MGYKVGGLPDVNQPANILEEIVWYKAKEIEAFRDKQPLPMLQVQPDHDAGLEEGRGTLGMDMDTVCATAAAAAATAAELY